MTAIEFFQHLDIFEGGLLLFIQNNLRTPWLTPVVYAVTSLGNYGIFWIALTLVLMAFGKTRRAGIICALALIISLIADNIILKNLFARTRPYDAVEGIILIGKRYTDYSFPSGHTGSSFAAATAVFIGCGRKAGAAALVLAGAIALSRLYIGVHYPTDILGGIAVGIMSAFLAEYIYNRGKNIFKKQVE